jgi:DNA-binding NarL/FixJ family response regulator
MSALPRLVVSTPVVDALRIRVAELESSLRAVQPREQRPDPIGEQVVAQLTRKQKQIIACLMQGMQNKQIGLTLGITVQVIKNHFRPIFEKCGVNDRVALVLFVCHHPALRRGLRG